MRAGSYSSTSRPSIMTLAPCATMHRDGPSVAWMGSVVDPRPAQRIGPRQPKRKHAIVRSVAREQVASLRSASAPGAARLSRRGAAIGLASDARQAIRVCGQAGAFTRVSGNA